MRYSYKRSRVLVKLKKLWRGFFGVKDFLLLALGLTLAYVLLRNPSWIVSLSSWNYGAAFLAGILLPLGWTAIPAIALLLLLAKNLSFWWLILIAFSGSLVGNSYLTYCVSRTITRSQEFIDRVKKRVWLFLSRRGFLGRLRVFGSSEKLLPFIVSLNVILPVSNQWGISLLKVCGYDEKKSLLLVSSVTLLEIFTVSLIGSFIP